MFRNIDAVIFDLDGTLIDSMWIWKQIDINFLAKYGHELPEDLQSEIEGFSFTETAKYFKTRFKIEDSLEDIKNEWNKMADEFYRSIIPLKENVVEFLRVLVENDIKLGIATSNSRELVSVITKRFGLHQHFISIVTSCDVNNGKPKPDVYLEVAKNLKVAPDNCLVFEDVFMGVMAGLNAGMRVCAVADQFSNKDRVNIEAKAHYYIENYSECIHEFNKYLLKREA